jgi:regulation of enolase protein 1 (concanavalin A-like superfamily)
MPRAAQDGRLEKEERRLTGMKPARRTGLLIPIVLLALGLSRPARAQIPGWTEKGVGDATGSATVDANGVWTIKGQSGDLWEREDNFFIVYKPLTGDGSITTKLLTAEAGADWSRLGVMMRDDLENPAAQTFQLYQTTAHGIEANYRAVTGDRMAKDQKAGNDGGKRGPAKPPVWFKIERRGDRLVGFLSEDGAFWTPVTRSHQFSMKNQIVAGILAESNDGAAALLTGTFDGKVTEVSNTLLKPEESTPLQPDPVIALGGNNAVLLMWDRVNHLGKDADGYVVYKAKVGDMNFTKVAELPGDKTTFMDDTIKNGEQAQYRVTTIVKVGPAADKVLESRIYPGSEGLLLYVTGAANPPVPIGGRDFFANVLDGGGSVNGVAVTDKPGSASVDASGVVTLRASGAGLNDRIDGGEQLVTPVTGDFTFTARVLGAPTVDGGDANESAKFGIAVRESTQANSRYAGMVITPGHGIRSPHRRLFDDGWTEDLGPNEDTPAFPISFRIQRRGDEIKMFTSADGKTFAEYGDPATTTLPGLVSNAYVGFIGSSNDTDQVAQAKFDQITLTTP